LVNVLLIKVKLLAKAEDIKMIEKRKILIMSLSSEFLLWNYSIELDND